MKHISFSKATILVLILTLFMSMLTVMNVCADSVTDDGIEYHISSGMVSITGYSGTESKIVIPADIEDLPVKSINRCAFRFCQNLEEIVLPDSIETIGDTAFENCSKLKKINIPTNVTFIDSSVFCDCTSLEKIVIPKGVEYIGDGAFRRCSNLKSISIPDTVTTIQPNSFGDCSSLESAILPKGLTKIPESCFSDCTSLKEITIPESVTVIEDYAFYNCKSFTSVTVPKNVTELGKDVFSECTNLEIINLPNEITRMGSNLIRDTAYYKNKSNWEEYALYLGPYLITVDDDAEDGLVIKEGTTLLSNYSLSSLDNVTYIVLPNSLQYIDEDAFAYCRKLESLIIPHGVKEIRRKAFECYEKLKSIVIPETVTFISESAFSLCPSNITIIGYKNSYAHEYASTNKRNFGVLDESIPYPPNVGYILGDTTLDGNINVKDATAIQKHIASLIKLHEVAISLADVDMNSEVNIKDATAIQKYIAGLYY